MPPTRHVFDTSENPTDVSEVIQKVLTLVESMDSKLDTLRAEHESLKGYLKNQDEQLMKLDQYVRGVDNKLQVVVAQCEFIRNEICDTSSEVQECTNMKDWNTLRRDLGDLLDHIQLQWSESQS